MDTTLDYEPTDPMAGFEDKAFEKYLVEEKEFMPAEGYAQSKEAILRKLAVRVIYENSHCDDFDAFVPYLALIYFDRFISKNPLPNVLEHVQDEVVLVANSCLMISWKMRHRNFRVLEFLAKTGMIEHQRFILPVELAILKGLGWKTRTVTAICFVKMFVRRIPVAHHINQRIVNEIIIQNQGSIIFTKFRPSVNAAAAILSACKLQNHGEEMYFICYNFILAFDFVEEEELDACIEITTKLYTENIIASEKDEQRPHSGESSQAGGPFRASGSFLTGESSRAGMSSQTEGLSQTGKSSLTGGSSQVGVPFQIGGSSQAEGPSQIGGSSRTRGSSQAEGSFQADGSFRADGSSQTEGSSQVEGSFQTGESSQAEGSSQAGGSSRSKSDIEPKNTEVDPESFQRHDIEPQKKSSEAKDVEGDSESCHSDGEEPLQETSKTKDGKVDPGSQQRHETEPLQETSDTNDAEVDPETQHRHDKIPEQETSEIKDTEVDPKTQQRPETNDAEVDPGTQRKCDKEPIQERGIRHRRGRKQLPEILEEESEDETEFRYRPIEDSVSEIQSEDETEFRRRPGKDIVSEIEEVLPVERIDDSDPMYFELKWLLLDPDAAEYTIYSPLFRPRAERYSARNNKLHWLKPVKISCSCLCPQPPDCSQCRCL